MKPLVHVQRLCDGGGAAERAAGGRIRNAEASQHHLDELVNLCRRHLRLALSAPATRDDPQPVVRKSMSQLVQRAVFDRDRPGRGCRAGTTPGQPHAIHYREEGRSGLQAAGERSIWSRIRVRI